MSGTIEPNVGRNNFGFLLKTQNLKPTILDPTSKAENVSVIVQYKCKCFVILCHCKKYGYLLGDYTYNLMDLMY